MVAAPSSPVSGGQLVRQNKRQSADIILSRAKHLIGAVYYSGVYMNKWLSEEEMKSVKILHCQCDELYLSHLNSNNSLKQGAAFKASQGTNEISRFGQVTITHDYKFR